MIIKCTFARLFVIISYISSLSSSSTEKSSKSDPLSRSSSPKRIDKPDRTSSSTKPSGNKANSREPNLPNEDILRKVKNEILKEPERASSSKVGASVENTSRKTPSPTKSRNTSTGNPVKTDDPEHHKSKLSESDKIIEADMEETNKSIDKLKARNAELVERLKEILKEHGTTSSARDNILQKSASRKENSKCLKRYYSGELERLNFEMKRNSILDEVREIESEERKKTEDQLEKKTIKKNEKETAQLTTTSENLTNKKEAMTTKLHSTELAENVKRDYFDMSATSKSYFDRIARNIDNQIIENNKLILEERQHLDYLTSLRNGFKHEENQRVKTDAKKSNLVDYEQMIRMLEEKKERYRSQLIGLETTSGIVQKISPISLLIPYNNQKTKVHSKLHEVELKLEKAKLDLRKHAKRLHYLNIEKLKKNSK